MRESSLVRPMLILLAVLTAFALGCGLVDSEVATITYNESVVIDVPVNADNLCPPADPACEGEPVAIDRDVELVPVEFGIDVDVIEATGKPELANLADRLRSIEVTSIKYAAAQNTLSFDMPPTKLYVGPIGRDTHSSQGMVELATIPEIPAGEQKSGTAPVKAANASAASERFKALKFSAVPYSAPTIKRGQNFPPSGQASVKVTINFKITANPLDGI